MRKPSSISGIQPWLGPVPAHRAGDRGHDWLAVSSPAVLPIFCFLATEHTEITEISMAKLKQTKRCINICISQVRHSRESGNPERKTGFPRIKYGAGLSSPEWQKLNFSGSDIQWTHGHEPPMQYNQRFSWFIRINLCNWWVESKEKSFYLFIMYLIFNSVFSVNSVAEIHLWNNWL